MHFVRNKRLQKDRKRHRNQLTKATIIILNFQVSVYLVLLLPLRSNRPYSSSNFHSFRSFFLFYNLFASSVFFNLRFFLSVLILVRIPLCRTQLAQSLLPSSVPQICPSSPQFRQRSYLLSYVYFSTKIQSSLSP